MRAYSSRLRSFVAACAHEAWSASCEPMKRWLVVGSALTMTLGAFACASSTKVNGFGNDPPESPDGSQTNTGVLSGQDAGGPSQELPGNFLSGDAATPPK